MNLSIPVSDRVSLGVFKHGWARVEEGREVFFINTAGKKFRFQNSNDVTIGGYHAIEYERELEENPGLLPRHVILMERNGLRGILNPKGEVVIPAEYTHIDMQYNTFWRLYKGPKKSIYLADGTILPFFDDIGYLDGEHFDVKQGDSWHIYRKSSDRIITETAYEAFDYCGGCGRVSPYVYAKKNGKWGIIDWEGNVLIPFEFDHEHGSMRSDNWVTSFSKNGEPVIVHIPTQQVFGINGESTELVSGMLVVMKDGKYGAFNNEGRPVVPFEYDDIRAPNQNNYLGYFGHYLIAEKGQKKGVIRSDGTLVVPIEYERIMVYDDYFVVTRNNQTSLLAADDTEIRIQIQHGDITHLNDYYYSSGNHGLSIFLVNQQAYYGLYFADSGVYYEPAFYDVSLSKADYFDGGVIVADAQGQKTLFNLFGELLLPDAVEDFEVFDQLKEPLLAMKVRGKWGLYDIHRKMEVVSPQHDRYFTVLENPPSCLILATIEGEDKLNRYLLYQIDGTRAVDQRFSTIDFIGDGYYLIATKKTGPEATNYAVFNAETLTLEQLNYSYVGLSGATQLLVVSDDRIKGKLYDIKARKTLRRDYLIAMFSGEISTKGGEDFPGTHDEMWSLSYFSDGLARVDTKNGLGYIDENERVVVEPKYGRVQLVGEHAAIVNGVDKDGGWQPAYFVDRNGNRLFPAEYYVDDVFYYNVNDYDLEDITVLVKEEENPNGYFGTARYLGLGNLRTGKMLIEAKYHQIIPLYGVPYMLLEQLVTEQEYGGGATVRKYGLATKGGEIVFEPKFDDIYYDDTALTGISESPTVDDVFPLLIREGDKWRYVNADGSYLPISGHHAHRY